MTKQSITAIALSLCLSGAMLTSCSESGEKTIETTKKIIKVFPIQKKTVIDTGEWIGYLRGVQDTDLYPRVSGFITEYKEGQYVEEGEVIYQIDSKPFEAELARSQANLAAAKAALQQAESSRDQLKQDVERYEQGAKSGAVSDKTLTDTKHNYAAAVAKVDACVADIKQQEAAVQRADINLKYASVKAPYAGFVGTSNVSTGDLVSQGTKLGNIISEGPLRVDFSINSDALLKSFERYGKVQSAHRDPELKDASPAFDILLEDGSVFEHKGRLLSMNSQIDSTGLIDIVGEVDNPDGKLRGGMKINVRIPLQTKETLLVPQNAIRTVMRNAFIIIVDKDNIPHTVPVTVGKEYEVEVVEANGYKSTQKLVSISDYKDTSLEEQFKKYGYGDSTEVPVVSDSENGVVAMNISSANSRIPEKKKELAAALKAQEESTLDSLLVDIGIKDKAPAPESVKPDTITTELFSFEPVEMKLMSASKEQNAPNPAAKPKLPPILVKVMPLIQQDVSIAMDWFGTLRGKEEASIRPHISGFIQKQHFRNGTIVNKGDLLYTIDPAPYQAELAQAQANLESAKARLDAAKVQLDKAQNDYERFATANKATTGAVAEKDLTDAMSNVQTQTAAVRQAEATVEQMEAAVMSAEINLGYTAITAPFTGRAGISNPSVGSLVNATDKEALVTLSSVNPMRIDFQVSGRDALRITNKVGKNNPNGAMEFDVILEDGSVYPAKGKIVSPDNVVKRSTGTFGIVAEVENVTQGLRSGMPVTVRAGLDERKGAFLVPARAPMSAEGHDLIVLVGLDNAPFMLPIKKGPLVTVPVVGADGKEIVQPMHIIEFNPELLQKMGYDDISKVQVVVEGSLMAASAYQENEKAGARVNKLIAQPFIYTTPKTVEPSVTADQAPTSHFNKF